MNGGICQALIMALKRSRPFITNQIAMLFLPSGLYRRYRNLTGSATRLADLRRMPPAITAGVDFHHALKQIKFLFAALRRFYLQQRDSIALA